MADPVSGTTADRAGVSPRRLALFAGVLAAALIAGAIVAYRELVHYERRAIEHVVPNAELGVRVDLENVVVFEPVRRHLLGLVDRVSLGEGDPAGVVPSRRERLRQRAGLNLGLDLRELVFARLPDGSWVLVLGGLFGSRPLLDSVAQVLRDEPGVRLRREAAMLILEPSGLALAQAADGVLLVGSGADVVAQAIPSGSGHESLGLDARGAAAFAARRSWLHTLEPDAPRVPLVDRALARIELGDPLELVARIEHEELSDPAEPRRIVLGWLGQEGEGAPLVPRADWGGERAIFARAHWTNVSARVTTMTSSWERTELDRAARSLAAWLESRSSAHGPVAQ